jgi:hypothetical protein
MSLISAGSISLDSAFKYIRLYKIAWDFDSKYGGSCRLRPDIYTTLMVDYITKKRRHIDPMEILAFNI